MKRLLLPILLVVAACSAEAPPKPVAPTPKIAAKPADPDALPIYRVAVAPAGLMLTDPAGGAARPADFGLRQSLLLAILFRSFGPAEEGHDAKCASDFARWPNGLTLWFDGGSFSGWSLPEEKAGAAVGIAPGVRRAPEMAAGAICR